MQTRWRISLQQTEKISVRICHQSHISIEARCRPTIGSTRRPCRRFAPSGTRVNLDMGPVAGNRRVPNTADLEEGLFMAGLEAHYSARDIEARILGAVRAAGFNPRETLAPAELGGLVT